MKLEGLLPPCPFCRYISCNVEQAQLQGIPADTIYYVECVTCGTTGPKEETESDAIAAWRHRAQLTEPMELTRELIDFKWQEIQRLDDSYRMRPHQELCYWAYEKGKEAKAATLAEPVKVPSEEIIEAVKAYGLAYSTPNTTATELTIRLQDIRALLAKYAK